jgi:hypothetical protein
MGRHPGVPGWGHMNSLVVAVVTLFSVLFAAGSLYVAILKLRQQAWSDAAIWIFAPLLVFGGLTMAAMGASAAAFLGLALLGAGVALFIMAFKYRKNPTYVDDEGKQQTVGSGWIVVFFALGALLIVGGGFVLTRPDMFAS